MDINLGPGKDGIDTFCELRENPTTQMVKLAGIAMAATKSIPLALGSDAHSPSEVGHYFDRIPALLG